MNRTEHGSGERCPRRLFPPTTFPRDSFGYGRRVSVATPTNYKSAPDSDPTAPIAGTLLPDAVVRRCFARAWCRLGRPAQPRTAPAQPRTPRPASDRPAQLRTAPPSLGPPRPASGRPRPASDGPAQPRTAPPSLGPPPPSLGPPPPSLGPPRPASDAPPSLGRGVFVKQMTLT
ncbi:hypothetical protein NHX12_012957 [Muraenolepis orangiensis]|uniref:Uncharacterized protein n=1 Tax=Muraenolepis orangiensis TaxID=630683 RepID=A0A9Q0DDG2_9TELE|nr:hypothetical protein NHX12_012957 [Muraenolepis orangiensis]